MIAQQINLYQDRFKEKRLLVSAAQLMTLLVVMLLAMAGWSYLIQTDLNQSIQQNQRLKASLSSVNNELAIATAEINRQLSDDRLSSLITDKTNQLRARKQVVRFVENNQFGSGVGFSAYLKSLSSLQIDNVWLDGIFLSPGIVKITGSALSADLVPAYFARFGEEAVFRGKRFHLFEVNRKPETDWKVDFTIATEAVVAK